MKGTLWCNLFGHVFLRFDDKENAHFPWDYCNECGLSKDELYGPASWEGEEWCNNNHGNVLERAKKDGAKAERARIRGEVEKLRKTDIERNLVGAAISIEDQCNERFNTALLAVLKVLEDK